MLKIKQLMTKNVVALESTNTLLEARRKMSEENIRHVVVTSGGKLTGILSDRDVLRADSLDKKISEFMSWPVYVLNEKTDLKTAIEEFLRQKVSAFVIEDSQGHLTGILTTEDILHFTLSKLNKKCSMGAESFAAQF